MAGKARASADAVALYQRLQNTPWGFGYFEAINRLEGLYKDTPGLGRSAHPSEDPIRISQEPVLHFAPATIKAFEPGENDKPDRLTSYFFGVFGPQSALPTHLTELALQRKLNHDDPTMVAFADIFHHRMSSLLYRAWAEARPSAARRRSHDSSFNLFVGALTGLAGEHLQGRDALPDEDKLHYASVLASQTRNAVGLEGLLYDYFGIETQVEEFVGDWMQLPGECHSKLGEDPENCRLGQTTVLGESVFGAQQKFRIVMGPMGIDEFKRMLPGGESIKRLTALVRMYAGDEKDWDVKLILKKEEIPPMQLGQSGALGWTGWMGDEARDKDSDDIVLSPMGLAA